MNFNEARGGDRRGGLKNDCQEAVVTYLLFLMFIDKRTGRMHDKPEPFLSALHRGSILACGRKFHKGEVFEYLYKIFQKKGLF